MSLYPNIERRDDGPRLTRDQADAAHWAQVEADNAAAYEHHINAACRAIQQTPVSMVTSAYIDSVLRSLGCKAMEAQLPELSEALESFADEVQA